MDESAVVTYAGKIWDSFKELFLASVSKIDAKSISKFPGNTADWNRFHFVSVGSV